jgi:hypothetical protein
MLGALLPDPQLHRRLGQRQLQLLVLCLQPPLVMLPAFPPGLGSAFSDPA